MENGTAVYHTVVPISNYPPSFPVYNLLPYSCVTAATRNLVNSLIKS